jgi:hypothetical protein
MLRPCLELFKVTSKGGVAEVWLLGQRLLELPYRDRRDTVRTIVAHVVPPS